MESYGTWDEPAAGVRRLRQQGAVLRRGGRVRRRPTVRRCCRGSRAASSPTALEAPAADVDGASRHGARGVRHALPRGTRNGCRRTRSSASCGCTCPAAQPAQRARRRRGRPRTRRAVRSRIAAALAEFRGAERRFQLRGEARGVMVVDDYGHHPDRDRRGARGGARRPRRRVVVVFQPHRYTRTRDCSTSSAGARRRRRGRADRHLRRRRGADSRRHASRRWPRGRPRGARVAGRTCPRSTTCRGVAAALARPGDLVITLGAGSIGGVGRILAAIGT